MPGGLDLLLVVVLVALVALVTLVAVLLRRVTAAAAAGDALAARLGAIERGQERTERGVREEIARGRQESSGAARDLRDEVTGAVRAQGDTLVRGVTDLTGLQRTQLDAFAGELRALADANARQLEALRGTIDGQLNALRGENAQKLEEMRRTVDEKLQATLEERIGASFRQVSDRLEQVHRGLGEMQTLAAGVGDLKRVLANVKARGTFGEVQLGTLLEQVLAPDQYATNVSTRPGSSERVEFAVRLPGPEGRDGDVVWLPVDAKFPLEDYQRLLDASERGDPVAVEQSGRDLEVRLKQAGREIRDKYLEPPHTTDFGLLFLPTEGLYAEVLRRPGLVDVLQREMRVVVAGPTTLWAILSSLRLGFRTLAIQKRSSEVWALLGAVKTEFGRFGGMLEAVEKKLQEASNKIHEAKRGGRRIERHLREVQDLPAADTAALLGPAPLFDLDADADDDAPA